MTKNTKEMVDVVQLEADSVTYCIKGTSPLMQNKFSFQAMQDLLYPPQETNKVERKNSLKHNPIEEFRGSIHESIDQKSATYAIIPPRSFIKAIARAAIDMPGTTKGTEAKRWVSIREAEVSLFGVPELYMTNCTLSGRAAVPDVRTRAVFRNWACTLTMWYDPKLIGRGTITSLFAGSGVIVGIGADRPERGGSFGKFEIVEYNNPEFLEIIKHGGRIAQEQALSNPGCFDRLSEQLLHWFNQELIRREQRPARKAA